MTLQLKVQDWAKKQWLVTIEGLSIGKASQLIAWLPSFGIFNRSKKKFKAHTVYFVVLDCIKIKFLVQAAEFKF